jgi:ATP-dependent DNA helicase RecQ
VTERARPILRGETKVMLREDVPDPIATRSRARGVKPVPAQSIEVPAGPFEALRAWRLAESKQQSVPPYVIFHDSVLRDVAAVQPRTLDDLALIKGFGASKLERYGAAVLRVLKEAT